MVNHLRGRTMIVRGEFHGFVAGDVMDVYLGNPLIIGGEAEFVCSVSLSLAPSLVALFMAATAGRPK